MHCEPWRTHAPWHRRCIDSDAEVVGVASVEGGAMSSPVWLMRTDPSPIISP